MEKTIEDKFKRKQNLLKGRLKRNERGVQKLKDILFRIVFNRNQYQDIFMRKIENMMQEKFVECLKENQDQNENEIAYTKLYRNTNRVYGLKHRVRNFLKNIDQKAKGHKDYKIKESFEQKLNLQEIEFLSEQLFNEQFPIGSSGDQVVDENLKEFISQNFY